MEGTAAFEGAVALEEVAKDVEGAAALGETGPVEKVLKGAAFGESALGEAALGEGAFGEGALGGDDLGEEALLEAAFGEATRGETGLRGKGGGDCGR